MMALLRWIKDIGANRLQRDIYVGRDLLKESARYYDQHFKDAHSIYATMEIIYIKAKK
jgi:hypothetical protein